MTTELVEAVTACKTLPVAEVLVKSVASAESGNVKTLLLAEEEGACKLKDPPPDAAFSLIFAVMVNYRAVSYTHLTLPTTPYV